ncbi:MAG TPA: hypothetical protein DCS12_08515 [Clostridiales bacterium]|nr:hypothetical protein [Clostridiales bacterium]
MITKKCKQCNKEFKVHNYRKDTAFFCSISCSKKGQTAWNKSNLINKCEICGNNFNVYPAIKDSKYCSHNCYWKSLIGKHFTNSGQFKKTGRVITLYSDEWNKNLRILIRQRDNYTCQICGDIQDNRAFSVHHIDYNKKNCNKNNLITLCTSCHSKTNYNRDYWINYFKIICH